jgi:hypothetical protein
LSTTASAARSTCSGSTPASSAAGGNDGVSGCPADRWREYLIVVERFRSHLRLAALALRPRCRRQAFTVDFVAAGVCVGDIEQLR